MSDILIIPQKRKAFYDALWGRWLIVLMMVFDLTRVRRGPVATATIAAHTPIHDLKTVRGYLRDLDARGFIAQPFEGKWVMTDKGQLVCERAVNWLTVEPNAELPEGGFSPKGGNPPTQNLEIPEEEDESLIKILNTNNSSSSSIPDNKEWGDFPPAAEQESEEAQTVRRYLDAIPVLFENTLDWRPEFANVKPEHALAWIAKAWMDASRVGRHGLTDPIGFIISRLRSHPNKWLVDHALVKLPDVYLEAVGLLTFKCGDCDYQTKVRAEMNAHIESSHPEDEDVEEEPTPVDCARPDETVTASVRSAWEGVLSTLRAEMPRVSFDTWVRDTFPVHAEADELTIGIRNAYGRDWMETRMRPTIARMVGRSVRFVVAVETEEG